MREIAAKDHSHTPDEVGAASSGFLNEINNTISSHEECIVNSEYGAHNLRWHNNKLEFYDGTDWIEIETLSKGVPPLQVSSIGTKYVSGAICIRWTDPEDLAVDNIVVSKWKGTKLVRKEGSYPAHMEDGVLVVDNQVKNYYQTKETYLIDFGLKNNTKYYYRFFTYSEEGAINSNGSSYTYATPRPAYSDVIYESLQFTGAFEKVLLRYSDPNDLVIRGQTAFAWHSTRLVRKAGSYPTSENDGDTVFENTVRNKYANTIYEDRGLTNNQAYYYRFFVRSKEDTTFVNHGGFYTTPFHYLVDNISNRKVVDGYPIKITWEDPPDRLGNTLIAGKWDRVKIVRSKTGYPQTESDGTVILDTTERNKYKDTPFEIRDAEMNTFSYYSILTYCNGVAAPARRSSFYAYQYNQIQISAGYDIYPRTPNIDAEFKASVGNLLEGSSAHSDYPTFKNIKLCNLVNGKVTAYEGETGFSYMPATGDVMVEIPKFYYKTAYVDNKLNFTLSNEKLTGLSVSPRHQGHTGHTNDYDKIYIGAFITDQDIRSNADGYDLTTTLPQHRTQAKAKGAGYYVWDFAAWWTICLLYLAEVQDWDSQEAIGMGGCKIHYGLGMSVNKIIGHTGRVLYQDQASSPVKYRHMENLWGNAPQWVDGVNFQNNQIYVCLNPNVYAENKSTNYTRLNYNKCSTDGYIDKFGLDTNIPWALLPTECHDKYTMMEDFYKGEYPNTGWYSLAVGGGSVSSQYGLFAMDTTVASTYKYNTSRLMYLPQ